MRFGCLIASFAILSGCGYRAQVVTEDEFRALPPFDAKVVETKPRDRRPGVRYHSAAIEPYTVTLDREDGSRLTVDHVSRDANWPWVAAALVPGRSYRFPEALYRRPDSPSGR